ncbi:MAG TPA: ZIP family metal transporter [Bacteroidales bacterium]|nr:ZIP family metal transporter [Bacteroidales bacterium]
MSLLVFLALVLPILLSGFSVFFFNISDKILKLILAFGGAFLLTLTFTELIPEIYTSDSLQVGLFVMLGFFIQLLLDFLTKGVEHGHHSHHVNLNEPCKKKQDKFNFVGLMVGICIHSFLEGMPLAANFHNVGLKNILLSGIVIHNIPISIVLVSLLIHTGLKKTMTILLLFLFAFSSPVGTITSYFFGSGILENLSSYFNYILAVVVGIFLHISTTILFETDELHHFNLYKFIAIILGTAVAMISILV